MACEWTQMGTCRHMYMAGCKEDRGMHYETVSDFIVCPFCGDQMKLVEYESLCCDFWMDVVTMRGDPKEPGMYEFNLKFCNDCGKRLKKEE